MTTPTRTVPRVLVQTASNLGSGNSEWTTQQWLTCLEWSDGAGAVVGYAKLSQWYGQVARLLGPNAVQDLGISPNIDPGAADSLIGKLVRVCIENAAGTISQQFPYIARGGTLAYETTRFAPVWHGIIRDLSYTVDGDDVPGGLAEFTAAGLASALDQVYVDRGYVLSADGSAVAILNRCPPFNGIGGGDRSSGTASIGSASVYIHDLRTLGGNGTGWTIRQIIDHVLAAHARPRVAGSSTGWAWAISDPTGALASPAATLDANGWSVLEVINALISQRRGLTWRLSVSGSTATINVQTTSATAIVGGSFSLPANTQSTSLTIADQPWLTELQVSQDGSASYDIISIIGRHPWATISIDYRQAGGGSLDKGWTSSQEATWDSATDDERNAGDLTGVWRRFLASASWTGVQYNSSGNGLRNSLATATSGTNGSGGYTGSRSFLSSLATAPSAMLKGERTTSIPEVIEGGSTTDERLAPKRGPMLFYFNGTSWTDVTSVFGVTVEDSPLAIVVNDGANGAELKSLLAVTGARLVATIGIREAEPLIVSWINNPARWPSSLPRVKAIEIDAEQEVLIQATVTGVSGSSLATSSAATYRDDVTRMQAMLALARAGWAEPIYSIRWQDRGRCLTDATAAAFAPATLITTVVDGNGSTTVNAIVLRRTCSWQGDHWSTSIEAERLPPDVPSL